MFSYRLQYGGYRRYRTYAVSANYTTIGFARYPRNRAAATEMGVPWRWEWSVNGTADGTWTQAAWSSRSAAAEELYNHTVQADYFPPRAAGNTVRAPRLSAEDAAARAFGVEIEVTAPSDLTIIETLIAAGIRMAPTNVRTRRAMQYGATNVNSHIWTLKRDSSVNGRGLELVSPKLRGQSGLDEVERVCAALASCEAKVDRSCGLHVHHDFRGLDVESLKRQVLAFVDREAIILELVAPSRRNNASYTPRWDNGNYPGHRDRLAAADRLSQIHYGIGPRGSINLGSYGGHGSVEIRAHAGTTNANKIIAWVRFGQALFAAAEAGNTMATNSPEALLSDLVGVEGFTAADAAWLLRFRIAGQTRQSVEARVASLRSQIASAESVLEEVS